MRMRFTAVLALVALAAACGGNAAKAPKVLDAAACPADAKPANLNFTLKDTAGKEVRLADYKGKVLLLDFWATWCGPCKVEIPGFIELYDEVQGATASRWSASSCSTSSRTRSRTPRR